MFDISSAASMMEYDIKLQAFQQRMDEYINGKGVLELPPNAHPKVKNMMLIARKYMMCGDICCAYCGNYRYNMILEHVWPESRGGSSNPGNLVTACQSCNVIKSDYFVEAFREEIAERMGIPTENLRFFIEIFRGTKLVGMSKLEDMQTGA